MLGLYVVIGGRGFVDVAYASRTFFGTYRVMSDRQHRSFTLFHGTTIHGRQDIGSRRAADVLPPGQSDRAGVRHASGRDGHVSGRRWTRHRNAGGVRTAGPAVDLLRDRPRGRTHRARCPVLHPSRRLRPRCAVVIGDARLSLKQRSDMHDVIVLDAFSSDSIPIHLLTREAVELYLSRLTMDGILAIHISNNHLNLRPVVAGVMRDLGLTGRVRVAEQLTEHRRRTVSPRTGRSSPDPRRPSARLPPTRDGITWSRARNARGPTTSPTSGASSNGASKRPRSTSRVRADDAALH